MEVRGIVMKEGKTWIAKLYPRNGDHSIFSCEGKTKTSVGATCDK